MFLSLAAGGGGAAAAAHLRAAQYGKRLLLLRGVRDAAVRCGHPEAGPADAGYTALVRALRTAPEAADPVLRYPTVGAWAEQTWLALTGERPGPARPGRLAAVAAAASIAAGLRFEAQVPVEDGSVVLPGLGLARTPGLAVVTVRSWPGGASITAPGLDVRTVDGDPGWRPLRVLRAESAGLCFEACLEDQDPDRAPGVDVLPFPLEPAEAERWNSVLAEAWRMLVRRHRTTSTEVAALVTALTPMVPPRNGQSSATPRTAFGNIGLSAPPTPRSLMVTLAHEVQHTKLTGLLDLVRLTRPDDGRRFYAPWRDDPRPASGLLQGVYAHLGIAGCWRHERRPRRAERDGGTGPDMETEREADMEAEAGFARWRRAAYLTAHTLAGSGALTGPGEVFVAEMLRTLRAWQDEPVPRQAEAAARAEAELHRAQWRERNGPFPPGTVWSRPEE